MKDYRLQSTFPSKEVSFHEIKYYGKKYQESLRNYTILGINCEETLWFNSKEKSPILLIFEIFRREEFLECVGADEAIHNNLNNKKSSESLFTLYEGKNSAVNNFNYLYYDYILSKPIKVQVNFFFFNS